MQHLAALSAEDSVEQAAGLEENNPQSPSLQQLVGLNWGLVQRVAGLNLLLFTIPWGQHVVIINKIKEPSETLFYLQQIQENNRSRTILTLQIEQGLHKRL